MFYLTTTASELYQIQYQKETKVENRIKISHQCEKALQLIILTGN